ncbi:MAG TPA: Uma2 family endonuclease [Urbifossiella sp.]|jgi:Uma2 family endonuclease|nr:Uma2 family endonuclease [Urbifossiella sp.]
MTPQQYHQMIEASLLQEGEPIELLEGIVVEKGTRTPPHDGVVTRLTNRLPRRLPPGWVTRIQCATALGDSEPEPDGAVVRGDDTAYDTRLPEPADFGLAIEVSDSTLAFDRRDKGRIYARAGIPVYWIVNVADGQVEVYTDPDPAATPPVYRARTDYRPGQDVPLALDGAVVASLPAANLLP